MGEFLVIILNKNSNRSECRISPYPPLDVEGGVMDLFENNHNGMAYSDSVMYLCIFPCN